MQFIIKEAGFTDRFQIKDRTGNTIYSVCEKDIEHHSFKLTRKHLFLKDKNGKELVTIKETHKGYEIYRDSLSASITEERSFLLNRFTYYVKVQGKDELIVKLSFWRNTWYFVRKDKIIFTAKLLLLCLFQKIVVEIPENEDQIFLLSTIVAIYLSYRFSSKCNA